MKNRNFNNPAGRRDSTAREAAALWGWDKGYARKYSSPFKANIYREWLQMLSRCYNPADPGFANEGARGITVADEWNPAHGGSFERFYADILSDVGEPVKS